MTEKKNILIVVVTRADAPKGSNDDEFVQEWGFADKKPFQWEPVEASKDSAYVLILHGCDETKGKLPGIFHKAIQEELSPLNGVSKAWFCHHGMKEEDRQSLENEIRCTFTGLKSDNFKSYPYSSMGSGPSVDNLLKELPKDLAKAVGDIFKGRLIFVKRLHALQSCLLSLQFCLAILYDVETSGKEHRLKAIEEAQMITNEIGETIGFKGFMKRIESLTSGRDDIQDTVELVRVLSGAKTEDDKRILAAPEFWFGYTETEPYNHLPDHHKLEDDFRLFAMALDCLMDVAANSAFELERTSSGTEAKTG